MCGSGIGTLIFAPFTRILLDNFGWKGTVLIDSAIMLNCVVCGLLFRPVEAPSQETGTEQEMQALNTVSKNIISSSLPDVKSSSKLFEIKRRRGQSESHVFPTKPNTGHMRKDAFYAGDLTNIPMYNRSKEEYQKTMTSAVQVSDDVKEEGCFLCKFLPSRAQLEEIMDPRLLCDVPFLLFCISNFLTSIGFSVPYIYLPDRGLQQDWARDGDPAESRKKLSILLSIVGLLNTVGRVIFGWLADRKNVNRLMMYNTVLVLCGIFCILSCFCTSFFTLSIYAGLYGFLIGGLLIRFKSISLY